MSDKKRKRGRPRKHPLPVAAAAAPAVAEVLPPDPVTAGPKNLKSALQNILPTTAMPATDPTPAGIPAPAALGEAGETGSPASGTASDNFERVAASVPPVIGDPEDPAAAAAGSGEPAPPAGGAGAPAPLPFDVTISRETVEHWIKVPFAILARVFDDDGCELEQWEEEIWIPAVQGVLNRYLPEFLRMTDKPELAMLGLAAATYIGMRTKIFFRRKKPAAAAAPRDIPVSMPGASTTAASRESSGTLDSLAPAKVI